MALEATAGQLNRQTLRVEYLAIIDAREKYTDGVTGVISIAGSAFDSLQEVGEVAKKTGMRPCVIKFLLQNVNHRPMQFHHHVMPVVTIFTGDVHATGKGNLLVENHRLHVIPGHPWIGGLSYLNFGVLFEK